jgi:hypothetical protein
VQAAVQIWGATVPQGAIRLSAAHCAHTLGAQANRRFRRAQSRARGLLNRARRTQRGKEETMAFKKNASLIKHDAAGAAAFWARWYLERENWALGNQQQSMRIKVTTDDGPEADEVVSLEGSWPGRHH